MEAQFRGVFEPGRGAGGTLHFEEIRNRSGAGLNAFDKFLRDEQYALIAFEADDRSEPEHVAKLSATLRRLPLRLKTMIERVLKDDPHRRPLMPDPTIRPLARISYRDRRLQLRALGRPANKLLASLAEDLPDETDAVATATIETQKLAHGQLVMTISFIALRSQPNQASPGQTTDESQT